MINKTYLKCFLLLIITYILLYSIVGFLFIGNKKNENSLDLMKLPNQVVYGQSVTNKDNIEIKVDTIGVALILFSIDKFNSDEFSQIELSIKNLPNN
jgi:hypothetical protein